MTRSQPYDLIVVGMGAAGVCAAIEAAERGLDVLVVDRFAGGGATAISGGVVYAGGGTSIQHEAGICLLYTSPSPRDRTRSRMPSSA